MVLRIAHSLSSGYCSLLVDVRKEQSRPPILGEPAEDANESHVLRHEAARRGGADTTA